mmetsp:Transcript_19000/g.59746  ORF Transcript_19000/g.59746 Transcript_19000/m.59746 type:complete len:210 (-) Transcript_19000:249-878(-)
MVTSCPSMKTISTVISLARCFAPLLAPMVSVSRRDRSSCMLRPRQPMLKEPRWTPRVSRRASCTRPMGSSQAMVPTRPPAGTPFTAGMARTRNLLLFSPSPKSPMWIGSSEMGGTSTAAGFGAAAGARLAEPEGAEGGPEEPLAGALLVGSRAGAGRGSSLCLGFGAGFGAGAGSSFPGGLLSVLAIKVLPGREMLTQPSFGPVPVRRL